MKVFALAVLEHGTPAKLLAIDHELSTFSYFQRGSAQEGMNFFIATISERTQRGQRATVQQSNYTGHVYVRADGLVAAIICDAEYPSRVAFSILAKVLDEFKQKFPTKNITPANTLTAYPELHDHLMKAQNPQSTDPFMKVQKELDETKVILHTTMTSLLQRGEVLDDLVDKSNQLSMQSKLFYKTSKKANSSCCSYT